LMKLHFVQFIIPLYWMKFHQKLLI
jgi:hypothetical protein